MLPAHPAGSTRVNSGNRARRGGMKLRGNPGTFELLRLCVFSGAGCAQPTITTLSARGPFGLWATSKVTR